MKTTILIFLFLFPLLGCKKDDITIVSGIVRDNQTQKGIEGARIGIFKIAFGSFGSSYSLIKEVYSDANGRYEISTNESAEIILAAKRGYFEDPNFTSRKITANSNNELDITLYPACKVIFNLYNVNNRDRICIGTSFATAHDCEFDYSSECYYNFPKDTTTYCYLWGGDSAKIEYWYFQNGSSLQVKFDTTVFCPVNGVVDLKLTY